MSCIFGTAHCKPWRSKGSKGLIQKESDNAPGKCVSMDQLVSAQPGLIPQMAGFFLTNLRIWGAMVFANYYSDYVYVALMWDLTLDKTLLAKTTFERHANERGFFLLPIEPTTVNSQTLDFKKQLSTQIKPLLFLQFVHIIKAALSNSTSKN